MDVLFIISGNKTSVLQQYGLLFFFYNNKPSENKICRVIYISNNCAQMEINVSGVRMHTLNKGCKISSKWDCLIASVLL